MGHDSLSLPARRALLLALNDEPRLRRDVCCLLGQRLEAWWGRRAPDSVLAAELGLPAAQMRIARAAGRDAAQRAAGIARRCAAQGTRILTRLDPGYPRLLFDLPLPPPVLFLRGELPAGPAVAIVGSRRADAYGREAARAFAGDLARAGLGIVSGFARGIDEAAHRGALEAGGWTAGVLGCGVDVDYPRHRPELRRAMDSTGALLSEFPLGTPPLARHFPIRNRLIAALGFATLVVQAAPRSGSLITARLALELGREVLAVPGPIFAARSAGPNQLLRDGAVPALEPADVLATLPQDLQARIRAVGPGPAASSAGGPAETLLALLEAGDPQTAETLAGRAGEPVERVLGWLLELELDGRIDRHPGPAFTRRPQPTGGARWHLA